MHAGHFLLLLTIVLNKYFFQYKEIFIENKITGIIYLTILGTLISITIAFLIR